jgi:BirA family biotin operon repressor/biotin-[acetyl-CoA-carboxylase] ligase
MAVATFHQTAGRGQRGTVWLSKPNANIHYSLLLYPDTFPISHQWQLSQAVAWLLLTFLRSYVSDVCIKWPNDIYWKTKKMAGILIEQQTTGLYISQTIIGIGININQSVFPSVIPQAISLTQITRQTYSLQELTVQLHKWLATQLPLWLVPEKAEELNRLYLSNLYRKEGFFAYWDEEGPFEACIEGIDSYGRLLLKRHDGQLKAYDIKQLRFID